LFTVPVAITCPACGAADPGASSGPGTHACQYCGARYRLDATGHVHAVATPNSSAGLVLALVAAAAGLVCLVGAIVAVIVLRTADADSDYDMPDIELDLSGLDASTPAQAAPLAGVGVAVELAAPTPAPVASAEFVEHSQRTASDGSLWILGMLTNTSDFALDTTEVIAVLRDEAGEELGTHSGYSKRDVLAAGEASPVQILVQDAPTFSSIAYEVDADVPMFLPARVEGLRVEARPATNTGWGLEIEGKVHHDGTVPAKFVEIEVQAWDADGKLVGLSNAYAKGDVLKPGQSARWKVLGLSSASKVARMELFVDGRPAD
jgi:hypothetical protein